MLLLGHRGARRAAPENTFLAFELALEHGCDGFEFDVRKTSDAQAIICHDADIQRVPIADNSYLNLAKLNPGPKPRLEDVVRRYAGRAFLDIELKVAALDECVTAILQEAPPQKGYCVSSFLPDVLESLHRAEPGLKLGYICDDARRLDMWRKLPVEYVIPQYSMADEKLIGELHAAGKQVFVWTVNQEKEMKRMAALGVDAIISDDTQLLCRALRKG